MLFLATDINPHAAMAAQATMQHNHVTNGHIILTSFTSAFAQRLPVDILLFNPPYVPTPDDELHQTDIIASWAGGKDGRVVIDELLPQVQHILSSKGVFYMIAMKENKPQEIMHIMAQASLGKFVSKIVASHNKRGENLFVIKFWRN